MTVADIGCGERPWRDLIVKLGGSYVGVDLQQNRAGTVDVISDLNAKVNLGDNAADVVLFTEVMEHLNRAAVALKEIARVLKPGGVVILTTPFLYRLHEEPYDYQRFTIHYFESEMPEYGFEVADLRKSGNIAEVWATIWDDYWCLERDGKKFGLARRLWNAGMRAIGHFLVDGINIIGIKLPQYYYLSNLCLLRKRS